MFIFYNILIDLSSFNNIKFNSLPNSIWLNSNYSIVDRIILGNSYYSNQNSDFLNYLYLKNKINYLEAHQSILNQNLYKNSSNIDSLIDRTEILKNQNLVYRQKIFQLERNLAYKEEFLSIYIKKFSILNNKVDFDD